MLNLLHNITMTWIKGMPQLDGSQSFCVIMYACRKSGGLKCLVYNACS